MPTAPPVRHRLELAPWLLTRNDDALGGRLPVLCGCEACGRAESLRLPAGVWSLEHWHGRGWTARLVGLPQPSPALDVDVDPVALDVEALAAGLAEAFTTTA